MFVSLCLYLCNCVFALVSFQLYLFVCVCVFQFVYFVFLMFSGLGPMSNYVMVSV